MLKPPCKSNDDIDKNVSILKIHWGDLGDDVSVQGLEGRDVSSNTSQVSSNTYLSNKKQKKFIYKEQPVSFNQLSWNENPCPKWYLQSCSTMRILFCRVVGVFPLYSFSSFLYSVCLDLPFFICSLMYSGACPRS